ncbi:MAG: hypothetical protein ACYC1D_03710 [Acidimicrobiales bacterium]
MDRGVRGDSAGERHISGTTIASLVRHVRRTSGTPGVQAMLEAGGERRPLSELEDSTGWSTFAETVALFEAAATVTGDASVGKRVGQELADAPDGAGSVVLDLIRSLGSPSEVYRNITVTGAKFTSVLDITPLDVGDDRALVAGEMRAGLPRHRLLCDFTAGALSAVPAAFGMPPAAVDEVACQNRGDPRCVYQITWDGSTSSDRLPGELLAFRQAELDQLRSRLSMLQSTVVELVSAGSPGQVLAAITRRAGTAVRATGYLSVVKLPADLTHRIHQEGIPPADVPDLVQDALDWVPGRASGSRLVVDVASPQRHYGRLAALLPQGSRFFAQERRLLETYAHLAAAALDTVVAVDNARRRNEVAQVLLRLSSALARSTSPGEISEHICDTLDAVAGCDVATVFLWDRQRRRLTLRAARHLDPAIARRLSDPGITVSPSPMADKLGAATAPVVLSAGSGDEPAWERLVVEAGLMAVAVMPIRSGARSHGFVSAGIRSNLERLAATRDGAPL